MKKIDYVFNIGKRCNSTEFLKTFKLRKFSSPFDWIFIDIETSLDLIKNEFKGFLDDIVYININSNIKQLINGINYDSIDSKLIELKYFKYITHDYNNNQLFFNQKFLPKNIDTDLYNWDRILLFLHYNFYSEVDIEKIKRRQERFQNIIKENTDNVLLFYLSQILTNEKALLLKENIIHKVKEIKTNIVIVLCIEEIDESKWYQTSTEIYDNLYIIKFLVPSYEIQINKWNSLDNHMKEIENVYIEMKKYFSFI